jgi:hypothetical protein
LRGMVGFGALSVPSTCYVFLMMVINGSVNSADVALEYRRRIIPDAPRFLWSSWVAQANYTFDCLEMTSNCDDYGAFQFISKWRVFDDPGSQS